MWKVKIKTHTHTHIVFLLLVGKRVKSNSVYQLINRIWNQWLKLAHKHIHLSSRKPYECQLSAAVDDLIQFKWFMEASSGCNGTTSATVCKPPGHASKALVGHYSKRRGDTAPELIVAGVLTLSLRQRCGALGFGQKGHPPETRGLHTIRTFIKVPVIEYLC